MPREPEKLFGGRLRTSTFVLLLVFAGILVLYFLVRPAPAQSVNRGNPTPTVQPRRTPSATPSPTRSTTPSPARVSPTPSSSELLSPAPSTSPTPTTTHASVLPLPTHS